MTNGNVLYILEKLEKFSELYAGTKCTKLWYAISKNINKLKEEKKVLLGMFPPHEKTQEYIEKTDKIKAENCIKNEDGTPKTKKVGYAIHFEFTEENKAIVTEKIKELEKEYLDMITHNDKAGNDFDEFLKEESTFELYTVKESDITLDLDKDGFDLIVDIIA